MQTAVDNGQIYFRWGIKSITRALSPVHSRDGMTISFRSKWGHDWEGTLRAALDCVPTVILDAT